MKKLGFVTLVLVLIFTLGFLTRSSLVKSAMAQYYGGCYVCA